MTETRYCCDLDKEIDFLVADGYRLDMITPADSPREVQLSKNDEVVRLILNRDSATQAPAKLAEQKGWSPGRAGMMYRDVLPNRLGGQLIASHIRITEGGEVPDYVHYHKVRFQLIYCLRGSIRVVYEDQGPPFWLEPGDCVLQPSEIRHRVLEAKAGSEVLEISSPAEHETWIDHQISLPTNGAKPDRLFGTQRFVRSIASEANWITGSDGVEMRHLDICEASNGLVDVSVRRTTNPDAIASFSPQPGMLELGFVVAGKEKAGENLSYDIDSMRGSSAPIMTEILRIVFRDISHFDLAAH
jgi:quercetin dioxygenase-like cupin family protein